MTVSSLIDSLSVLEVIASAGALFTLLRRKEARNFFYLSVFLWVRLCSGIVLLTALLAAWRHPELRSALYRIYFYVYWSSYALEAFLLLSAVYGIYRLAMSPLLGLQRLGMLVFRWAAAISIAVSLGLAFGPHMSSFNFIIRVVTQLQQTSSILTLSLLLFVCFAIRPMGLSYRSRIFGVSLGLGILAASSLISSAWIVANSDMFSILNMLNGLAICSSFVVWIGYFALPEPKRRMIVLPTTSPFLRWNQISQALGDEPGYVAIAGVPPDMFGEAEIEVMKRASRKMADYPEMA